MLLEGFRTYWWIIVAGLVAGLIAVEIIKPKVGVRSRERFSVTKHSLLIGYFAMGFVSLFSQKFSFDAVWPVLNELLVAAGVFAWLIYHKQQKLMALEWMVVFSCILWIILVYSLFFSSHPGKEAPVPFFKNANYFSAALSIALPFMLWIGWSCQNRLRWLGWVVSGSFLFGIFWFQSRGAWVGLAGGLIVFVWYLSRNRRQRLAIIGLLVVGMTSLIYWTATSDKNGEPLRNDSWTRQLRSVVDTEHNFSNRERITRWKIAFRLFADSPILGIQPGRYEKRFKFKLENMEEVEQISYWYGWNGGAHSEYLTRLAERGLPATLMFIGYFTWTFVVLFRLIKYGVLERKYGAFIAFALATWMVHGLFNDLSTEIVIWMSLMLISGYTTGKTKGLARPT